MIDVLAYWILGTYLFLSGTLALLTVTLDSCESLGSTFCHAVGLSKDLSLHGNLLVTEHVF